MIKRLRRKFILINLLLVGLVLAVVFIRRWKVLDKRTSVAWRGRAMPPSGWPCPGRRGRGRPALKSAARRRRSASRTGRTASP